MDEKMSVEQATNMAQQILNLRIGEVLTKTEARAAIVKIPYYSEIIKLDANS